MKQIFSGKIWTIPNVITFSRIVMIPFFVWAYVWRQDTAATALILALSGLSDVLDGWIARRFDMVSDFGKALDPVADKLTQAAMTICLACRFPRMIVVVITLFAREIFDSVTSLMAIRKTGKVCGAEWHGKLTTVVLYATMVTHLLYPELPQSLSDALIVACFVLLVISAVLYGVRNVRMIRSGKEQEP